MTLKIKVKVISNQWHLKTIEWSIGESSWIWEPKSRSIGIFTWPYFTYHCPFASTVGHWRGWGYRCINKHLLLIKPKNISIVQGFHRTYATGAACQQRTLTPPDTWSCPTLGLAYVLMSRPISPELVLSPDLWISNTPRYFSFAF